MPLPPYICSVDELPPIRFGSGTVEIEKIKKKKKLVFQNLSKLHQKFESENDVIIYQWKIDEGGRQMELAAAANSYAPSEVLTF